MSVVSIHLFYDPFEFVPGRKFKNSLNFIRKFSDFTEIQDPIKANNDVIVISS